MNLVRSGRWWIAEAPMLEGAYTQGRTREAARKRLRVLVAELLETYGLVSSG
jgi:predicted RNase H-like HicB family nuclease